MIATKILSGKEVSSHSYDAIIPRIQELKNRSITPGLAVILVGDDPSSQVYVRNKTRKFQSLDLFSETIVFPSDTTQTVLIRKIEELNSDDCFHGILVQLPLPEQIDIKSVLETISPLKDVDGFHPENIGRLTAGTPRFIPCTPKGIMRIFDYYKIELSGKHIVVVGRSNIVGRPISILTSLKQKGSNATTTICHSGTKNIHHFTRQADIIIAAIGSPELIDENYVKEGVCVIDVGMNRVEADTEKGYKLVGDVNRERLLGIASAITPVPGGVGLMTIAMLVENTVEAAELLIGD